MNETIRIRSLSIPRLGSADLPEFATPEARAAFEARQTENFGDFDELIARTQDLLPGVERQLAELDGLLAGREQVDADDFLLYPSLRMLSIVKGVKIPANVRRYMERMERSSGVPLHFDQARCGSLRELLVWKGIRGCLVVPGRKASSCR